MKTQASKNYVFTYVLHDGEPGTPILSSGFEKKLKLVATTDKEAFEKAYSKIGHLKWENLRCRTIS